MIRSLLTSPVGDRNSDVPLYQRRPQFVTYFKKTWWKKHKRKHMLYLEPDSEDLLMISTKNNN